MCCTQRAECNEPVDLPNGIVVLTDFTLVKCWGQVSCLSRDQPKLSTSPSFLASGLTPPSKTKNRRFAMISKELISRLPQLWRNAALPSSNWYTVSVSPYEQSHN